MIPLRDNIVSRKWPFVNTAIILLNAYVFYWELKMNQAGMMDQFIQDWGLIPFVLIKNPIGEGYRFFSSLFLHGGWIHLLGNMLYLYIFGDNVEDRLGHFNYLFFYLFCGILASLTQMYFHPASQIPMIGASGAIAGTLGAYFLLYPKAKVLTAVPIFIFIRIMELPAYLVLGLWFVIQAWSGRMSLAARAVHGDVGGVAWWAHAGGFIVGMIYVILFVRKEKRNKP